MATIFGERLEGLAAARARHPAWVDGAREVGFAEAAAEVAACARWLAANDVAEARVVGVSIADERRNAVVGLALLALGVPQVVLATTDPVPMRSDLARRLGVGRVLADGEGQGLDGAGAVIVPARLPHADGLPAIDARSSDPDAPAIYITSSGTTGRPKILAYTQRAIALRAASLVRYDGHGPGERVYVPMRAQNFFARVTRLYLFAEGTTSILHDGATAPADIVDRCIATRVTILYLSALQASSLANAGDGPPRLPAGVKSFSNSARLPEGMRVAFERGVGGRLFDRYGATEVGVVASTYPGGDEGVPDAVGRVLPGVEVEIVDEQGAIVPRGTAGEIRARTPQMTTGYVGDAELTRRHFRAGWFHPGDMGMITPAGVLRFLGRRDDMLSLGGFNIFPSEIERVLDAHPAVRASAAFPVRSRVFGEIPVAAVELRADDTVTAAAILAYARDRLGVRAPRRIELFDAFPRNAAGKILKAELATRVGQRIETPRAPGDTSGEP